MIDSIERFEVEFKPTLEILALIAEIDEFKGKWTALRNLSPERLLALRRVATIESVGSSTRIEGVKLSDREIEALLSNLKTYSFKSRDEEEVAGYAEAMELIFESWREIDLTENHLKQIHSTLLKFTSKDAAHRGVIKNCRTMSPHSMRTERKSASFLKPPRRLKRLWRWKNLSNGLRG